MGAIEVGDKVKVTLEGRVTYVYRDKLHVDVDAGFEEELEEVPVSKVEVLEKVFEAWQDLIGTVRQGVRGSWVKVGINRWVLAGECDSSVLENAAFTADNPIIGAVPGTPAAQAQEPKVIQYDDDEPDRSKKYKDVEGDIWWYSTVVEGWTCAEPYVHLSPGDGRHWVNLILRWFPMTEVQD